MTQGSRKRAVPACPDCGSELVGDLVLRSPVYVGLRPHHSRLPVWRRQPRDVMDLAADACVDCGFVRLRVESLDELRRHAARQK